MKSLTQRLKRFSDDERGVSPVVGFVLIFALIMIVFTIYQANVVPAQNKQVEFKHSQVVEGQMNVLNDAIQQVGSSGVPQSVTIDTGVQYPDRALAINPGSPAGTLRTGDDYTFKLDGVDVEGSAYWNKNPGTGPSFTTKPIAYTVNYNVEQQDPTFIISNGILQKKYGNGELFSTDHDSEQLISGNQINLYLLGGQYQESAATASPTIKPISTSTEYLHFKSDGQTEIPLATSSPSSDCKEKWKGILGPGFSGKNGNKYGFVKCNGPVPKIKLKPNRQFTLRITKVGFGDVSKATPEEVVPTEKTTGPDTATADLNATVGEPVSFTVLVRDKYGNPVQAGLTANGGSSVDESNIKQKSLTTNEKGKATFTYAPGAGGDKTIHIGIDGVDTDYDTATYKFHIHKSGNGDDSNDSNGEFVPGPPKFERMSSLYTQANYQGQFSFDITPKSSIEIDGFAIETKYDLSNLIETDRIHKLTIDNIGVAHDPDQPIQFDGRKYSFGNKTLPGGDNAHVEIYSYDQASHDGKRLKLDEFVDSPREADLEVIFFLSNGSQRAVYIDGHFQ